MVSSNHDHDEQKGDARSCEPSLSRQEFLTLVLKRGSLAGAILAAPKIVDAFLVPPAHAMMYTGGGDTAPGIDTTTSPSVDA